jgi:hypothetical protein
MVVIWAGYQTLINVRAAAVTSSPPGLIPRRRQPLHVPGMDLDRFARPERFELPTLRFEVAKMILQVLSFQLVSRPALSRNRHRSA